MIRLGLLIRVFPIFGFVCYSSAQEWFIAEKEEFLQGNLKGLEVTERGMLRLTSFEGVNFALGTEAFSDGTILPRGSEITDGNLATEWDFDEDPKVVGKTIDIDLGGNRLVNQVRVLPGSGVGADNPEYFVKGYRFEVAPEEAPDAFTVVAQNFVNQFPRIDTTADGTWLRYVEGAPVAALGRYVRVTITRQDLPNWVIIGDIEVFGTGFQARGEYLSPVHKFADLVNVGVGFFEAKASPGTRLRMQFRGSIIEGGYPSWDELPYYEPEIGEEGVYFPVQDPIQFIQYRCELETSDPHITPNLQKVRVGFDPRLLASLTRGSISPQVVPMGESARFTYSAMLFRPERAYPTDLLVLDRPGRLEELIIDGRAVPTEQCRVLTMDGSLEASNLAIQLDPALSGSNFREVQIGFTTSFFSGTEGVDLFVGSIQEGADPKNLQKIAPIREGSTLVRVIGVVNELVPAASVAIRPRVFRPERGGGTRIEFDLTKVLVPVPVTVTIHDLSGRRVCTVVDGKMLSAGEISIPWDGFDDHGGVLAPGIYMCRIRVHAQESVTLVRFLGIAY